MNAEKNINMRTTRFILPLLALALLCTFTSCNKNEDDGPYVRGTVNLLGDYAKDNHSITMTRKDVAVYRFDIQARGSDLRKIELWQYKGTGINAQQPLKLNTWEYPAVILGRDFTIDSSTLGSDMVDGQDVQYSVYAEDMDGNYTSLRLQVFVDIFAYSLTGEALYTGSTDATSRTFLNLQSGRRLVAANTISDPEGIDLGFAWLGSSPAANPAQACLVSFDQYWKTGIYNMFANEKNGWVKFRKVTMTGAEFGNIALTASNLKTLYDNATVIVPPDKSGFEQADERIAPNLAVGDVLALTTRNGRYGLIRITNVNSANKGSENVQMSILITK